VREKESEGKRVGKFGHDRWSSAIIGETIARGEEQVRVCVCVCVCVNERESE
jgi:hypothetical protein